jgi:hypothetical protein
LNLDPFASEADDPAGRYRASPEKLDDYVCANEASELVAHDVLDHFPAQYADAVLDHWVSRLAHGGTITVSVLDAREVCRAYMAGKLTNDNLNDAVYGNPKSQKASRKCLLTLPTLVAVLEAKGLRVLQKRYQNLRAVVTAQRP